MDVFELYRKIMTRLEYLDARDIQNELYNIMSAIRGPDNTRYGVLKFVFTGRIRYLVFGKFISGVVRVNKYFSPDTAIGLLEEVNEISNYVKEVSVVINHYLDHVRFSLDSLRNYVNDDIANAELVLLKLLVELIQKYLEEPNLTNLRSIGYVINKLMRSCLTCKYYEYDKYKYKGYCKLHNRERYSYQFCQFYEEVK